MSQSKFYTGQFAITPDYLHVTIPQAEILHEMANADEHEVLNNVCLAVAVVADAISAAQIEAADTRL